MGARRLDFEEELATIEAMLETETDERMREFLERDAAQTRKVLAILVWVSDPSAKAKPGLIR